MPGDGTVHKPPSLELILVSAKRLRPRPFIHVAFLLTWHSLEQLTRHSLEQLTWHSLRWECDVLSYAFISRHVARSYGWGWVSLALLQANVITFQKCALKAQFHYFPLLSALFIFFSKTLRLLRSSSSRKLIPFQLLTTKGMVFLLRWLFLFTVLLLYLPGTVYIYAFLCSSPFPPHFFVLPLFWISRVGRGLLRVSFPFTP